MNSSFDINQQRSPKKDRVVHIFSHPKWAAVGELPLREATSTSDLSFTTGRIRKINARDTVETLPHERQMNHITRQIGAIAVFAWHYSRRSVALALRAFNLRTRGMSAHKVFTLHNLVGSVTYEL